MILDAKFVSIDNSVEKTNVDFELELNNHTYIFLIQKNDMDKYYYMTVFYDDETIILSGIRLRQGINLLDGQCIPKHEMYIFHSLDKDLNKEVNTEFFNEWVIGYGKAV